MTNNNFSRREALKGLGGAAITTSIAGCSGLPGQKSELEKQVATVRKAIEPYDGNPQKAIDDGFDVYGPFSPGIGWNFKHNERLARIVDEGFNLEQPPLLVYDSEFNLGGAEFSAPANKISQNPDLFADEGSATEKWSAHNAATHVFATPNMSQDDPRELAVDEWAKPSNWTTWAPPEDTVQPGDTVNRAFGFRDEKEERVVDGVIHHPEVRYLRVWAIVDNPDGLFATANPDFAQY